MSELYRFREARKFHGMTQVELAELVGCTQATICRIEKGLSFPSDKLLIRIADELDVSIDYLLNRSRSPWVRVAPIGRIRPKVVA